MKLIKIIITHLIYLTFLLLTGCASITNGVNESVSVETTPTRNALCTLNNDKGKWFITKTPGSVTVHRSYQDLNVECKKAGYTTVTQKVPSKTKPMAFGNILFGGVIGAGVDTANGAAYDYPASIIVPMKKIS